MFKKKLRTVLRCKIGRGGHQIFSYDIGDHIGQSGTADGQYRGAGIKYPSADNYFFLIEFCSFRTATAYVN